MKTFEVTTKPANWKDYWKTPCVVTDLVVCIVFLGTAFYETDTNNNIAPSHALHNIRSIAGLIPQSLQLEVQVTLTSLGWRHRMRRSAKSYARRSACFRNQSGVLVCLRSNCNDVSEGGVPHGLWDSHRRLSFKMTDFMDVILLYRRGHTIAKAVNSRHPIVTNRVQSKVGSCMYRVWQSCTGTVSSPRTELFLY